MIFTNSFVNSACKKCRLFAETPCVSFDTPETTIQPIRHTSGQNFTFTVDNTIRRVFIDEMHASLESMQQSLKVTSNKEMFFLLIPVAL